MPRLSSWSAAAVCIVVAVGLYVSKLFSYVLFHSLVELFSVVVAFGIFSLAWATRRTLSNHYLLLVGIGSLFVGLVDLVHTLAYKGMGVFPTYTANLPTQLWIVARYMQALTLLASPYFIRRKLNVPATMAIYALVTMGLVAAPFLGYFPNAYVEGQGLTPFKVSSEYVIIILLIGATALLWRARHSFDRDVLWLLALGVGITIPAELAFTAYMGVYDAANMIGHYFKLVSFYCFYLSLVEFGLSKPLLTLYGDLEGHRAELNRERDFVAAILESAGALVLVLDTGGRIVRFNRTCEQVTGLSAAAVHGRFLWDLVPDPEVAERARQAILPRLHGGGGDATVESRLMGADGSPRLIAWTQTPLRDVDGQVTHLIAVGTDMTERRSMEEALRESEERLRMVMNSVQTGILLIDLTTDEIVDVNPAALDMLGHARADVVGQKQAAFFRSMPRSGAAAPLPKGASQPEHTLVRASGELIPIYLSSISVRMGDRRYLLRSFVDITQRKMVEDELRTLSLVDDLTGLYNRRGFMALARQQVQVATQTSRSMVLFFGDMDGMESINESAGHAEGDEALMAMADLLRSTFDESDLMARLGGDEFAVLCLGVDEVRGAELTARLQATLKAYNAGSERPYRIDVSLGQAAFDPRHPVSVEELLRRADRAMYVEKRRREAAAAKA